MNCFPALLTAGVPFVRIMSCNPLEVRGPTCRRCSAATRATTAAAGTSSAPSTTAPTAICGRSTTSGSAAAGAPPLPDLDFIHASEHLNLYLYPEALDYTDRAAAGRTWQRLDSSVRTTDAAFELPERLRSPGFDVAPDSALVYLSLGSLGSADVDLMRRLVDVLGSQRGTASSSARGRSPTSYELPSNMWGEAQVPQTSVLPLVDLVITPRRQQHDDRERSFRQADDRAAAVLGPVRQRPTGRRTRLREADCRPTRSPTTSCPMPSTACSPMRRCVGGVADIGAAVRARDGIALAADRLERSPADSRCSAPSRSSPRPARISFVARPPRSSLPPPRPPVERRGGRCSSSSVPV